MANSKTFYFVNAGTDASHIDFVCETFDKKKDAIAFFDSLTDHNYKEVKSNHGSLIRKSANGEEILTYSVSIFGIEFQSHKRTGLLKEVKQWMNENEESLQDVLSYNGFEYYGNIERTDTLELTSTLHVINGMIKKAYRAGDDTINNYKAL